MTFVLDNAAALEARGRTDEAFSHLERAHVLGQAATAEHARLHWAMLLWAVRNNAAAEAFGQAWRMVGALMKTWLGWLPTGNTGGADISGFKPMPVPPDLQRLIELALSEPPARS